MNKIIGVEEAVKQIGWRLNQSETAKYALGTSIPKFVADHLYIAGAKAYDAMLDERQEYERQMALAERYDADREFGKLLPIVFLVAASMMSLVLHYS